MFCNLNLSYYVKVFEDFDGEKNGENKKTWFIYTTSFHF